MRLPVVMATVCVVLAGSAPGQRAAASGAVARPNVILVLADDVGYGDLSCHGNPRLQTPHLDRLCQQSIRLTDFHVAPICTPTRSQLMTGLDALRNGAMNAGSGRAILRRGLLTMGEVFAAGGYRTALFGKWHLGHTYPYRPGDRGFQEAVWFPVSMISSDADAWGNDYVNDRYRHGDELQAYEGYCTDVFFREAMHWMRRQHAQGEPFFVYLPLNAAHYPYWVEPKYAAPYRDLPGDLPNFFGMIANLDENLGRLEMMLRETGLCDNTLLIFMTDNGTAVASQFHNAGMRGHKFDLWEGGHRVPCFLRWPGGGLREPGEVAELTECQDLLPTLIDMCGLPIPPKAAFDGISLAPLLRGETETLPDRMLVVQFSRPNVNPKRGNLCRPRKGDAAVLWKHWRLVNGTQLFDLQIDPGQKTNVAGRHPEVVARMRAHYDAWWQRLDPQLDMFEPTYVGAPGQDLTVLTPDVWGDPPLWFDQAEQVRRGEPRNGVWHLEVVTPGKYRFALRRWPPEVVMPITAPVPAHKGEVGRLEPGVALPIARARLRCGAQEQTKEVREMDESVDFLLEVPQGRTELQTWFYEADGRELCGAYYVVVSRIEKDNLIPDPGFERGAEFWQLEDSGSEFVPELVRSGAWALKLVNDFDGRPKAIHNVSQRRISGIEGGREYVYSVWVRGEGVAGLGPGGKPITELRWLDPDGKRIGRGLYLWAPYGTYPYTCLTLHAEAPAGATAYDLHFRSWWHCTGGASYWDDADLRVRPTAPGRGPWLGRHEAEQAAVCQECPVRKQGIGFTGAGYVDLGKVGAAVEWRIEDAGGPRTLSFRYAAEAGARSCRLTINGGEQGPLALVPTGMPTSWATARRAVTLKPGDNVIRLQPQPVRPGLYLDHLDLYANRGMEEGKNRIVERREFRP